MKKPRGNGFFPVSVELLHQMFQLPESVRIVGAERIAETGEIRFLVEDAAVPSGAAPAEYLLVYELVERDSRLKNIVRFTDAMREPAQ